MAVKRNQVFNALIEIKRKFIESIRPSDFKDYDGKSFTRNRRLNLAVILLIILRGSPMSLQVRLDDFFREIGRKEETVSKQAFSKARTKLNPDIVKASFQLTASTLASCDDLVLWAASENPLYRRTNFLPVVNDSVFSRFLRKYARVNREEKIV